MMEIENVLDGQFWDTQYLSNRTKWDLGRVSPPIQSYVDTLKDKNLSILIPGCGNSYEAEYLLHQGFTDVTVIDISPVLVEKLKEKFNGNSHIQIVLGDFFDHAGQYDLIIEQTFFCAIAPILRQKYVEKMHDLLKKDGLLAGLLFNRLFEYGPPFGGNKEEYEALFQGVFYVMRLEVCQNSIQPRANSELWMELRKK